MRLYSTDRCSLFYSAASCMHPNFAHSKLPLHRHSCRGCGSVTFSEQHLRALGAHYGGTSAPFASSCCLALSGLQLTPCVPALQSLVADESFQHILRVLNTNVDGKQKIMFALTSIKGIGRRFANLVCKKAEVDMNKR